MRRELVELLARRADFLAELSGGPTAVRSLVEALRYSRTTVNRALRELGDAGLVERTDGGYTTTPTGDLAWESYRRHARTTAAAMDAAPVVDGLPDAADLDPAVVAGATVSLADDDAAGERFAAVAEPPVGGLLAAPDVAVLDVLAALPRDASVTLVVAPGVLTTLCDRAPDVVSDLAARPATTLLVGETPAFSLLLGGPPETTDDDAGPLLVVHDRAGNVDDGAENGHDRAGNVDDGAENGHDRAGNVDDGAENGPDAGVHGTIELADAWWAVDRFASRRAAATPVDDVLASHLDGDPAAAEVHLRAAAPDAFDDDSELPASLARQGFERVTDDALDDDPVAPSDALRSGFTPAEVRHGYAIERVVDEAGEALSTHLVDRLADGEDCALVGPPGSGKSTSCMSAAVAWTERDLGPVLYRSGAADGTVDDPELLAAYARVLDGHVLVVAEDAPRAEASAAFEALTACGDDEDVSFLFDAREHEWRDAPSGRGALAAVSMPSLGPAAVERLVERVESLTGVDVDADAEELLEAVGDGAADGGPTPGAMYRLKHWLSLHADDAGATATPDSALTADVARVHEAVATVPLGTDVAVLANLLNLAGVAVRRELVYALVFAMVDGDYAPPETEREGDDAAAVGAVDDPAAAAEDALAALAGDCVFEWSREREPARFRCRHETWSTAFLVALLEEAGPEAARERVGRVVSALLSLADDDRLRERVVDALGGRGLHLRRASADPAGWADDVVEQLFAVPTDRGHLAPLYGHSDDSPVDLPDACSPAVELRVAARRGEAYDQQGDVTAARREHEWLLEHAGDLAADGATADEFRAEAGHRLATHARDEGDLERAERLLAESRERFRDLDDPAGLGTVERNLGIVGAMNGDRDAAEEHFEAALEHHREAGNRTGLANAYNDRGRLAKMRGELDVAADCLSAARDLSADVGDARREAVSTMNLGTVAMERNDFERARSLLVRALGLAREAGYESGVVSVLTNLGSAALRMDDLDDAEDHLQGALAKSRDLDDGRNEMRALRNLGEVARRRGHLEAAGSYLDEAAAVVEDPESRPGLVLFRARLARDRGDLEAAADRFRTITDDYPVRAGRDLADVARMQGDLDAAEARIERCLEHCRDTDHPPNHGATLAVRARVALDRGDLDGAATAVDRAADRCDPDDPDRVADFAVGTVRGRLHLRRGDYQAAVDQLRPVASAARDADVLRATLRAVDPLVQALVELDRPDAAASWCATAAEMAADAGRPDRQRAFRERRAEVAGTT